MNQIVGTDTTVEGLLGSEAPTNAQTFVVSDKTTYNSVDDLYKGAIEKEKFIGELINKVKILEEKVSLNENKANLEEGINKMLDVLSTNNGNNQEPTSQPDVNTIEKLVAETIQKQQDEVAKKNNVAIVSNKINAAFGAEAGNKLEATLKTINMSQEEYVALAAKNPTAALRMIGVQEAPAKIQMENLYTKGNVTAVENTAPTSTLLDELKVNGNNARWMAKKYEEAMRNPEILADLEWKTLNK